MRTARLSLLFCLLPVVSFCQLLLHPFNREEYYKLESGLNKSDEAFHTSIKPYIQLEVRETLKDTASRPPDKFVLTPLAELSGGYELKNSDAFLRTVIGAEGKFTFKNKIGGQLYFYQGSTLSPSYQTSFINQTGVVPNEGRAYGGMLDHNWNVFSFNISYKPSKYFMLQAGQGKYFLGEGYRSLLLSDFAPVYPYFSIQTNIWKFKYLNLYTLMDDLQMGSFGQLKTAKKFTMMHYLSWNIHRNFNISFFEAEIYQTRDTAAFLGLEPNYLNPVIFYRPVEYSMGSADNALLGGSMKFRFFRSHNLYFQLLLDEFLLSEIRARRGWWANKYAIQLGYKYFDAFKIDGLTLQAEYNYVRPFTYSHSNVSQNFGHRQHSLAHPFGANFTEALGIISYRTKNWLVESKTVTVAYGADESGKNFGQNIYRSYTTREKDFGNFTGQGLGSTLIYNQTKVGYIFPKLHAIAEIGIENRTTSGAAPGGTTMVFGGIRSLLFNSYRDY